MDSAGTTAISILAVKEIEISSQGFENPRCYFDHIIKEPGARVYAFSKKRAVYH